MTITVTALGLQCKLMSKPSQYRARCALCGQSGGRTREHVIPSWLWKDAPEAKLQVRRGLGRGEYPVPAQQDRVVVPTRDPCQKWLAKNFEQPAQETVRAMTRGEELSLPSDLQEFVSAYLIKTIFLFSTWRPNPTLARVPADYRHTFRRTGKPPENAVILIGCLMQDYETHGAILLGRVPQVDPSFAANPERLPVGARGGVVQFRHLIVHWLLGPSSLVQNDEPGHGLAVLAEAERLGLLQRIWPLAPETLEFPRERMSYETYRVLHDAIEVDYQSPLVPNVKGSE